ncbi:hypothetical protein [Autumnicola musiva]|uniref:Uncharacterized protein n=1 Tax=Autumnicola musiva TaxID=3075589 RepID=A0ABU3DAS0_9FLAO|nr:hypothetical protein [Zunongwangia sp. F117]MDT0678629.1 hypothetical protein [Zunongwangia sp. F117]
MITTLKPGATKKSIKTILKSLSKETRTKGVNAHEFVGKINLKKDPLDIQRDLRNEWE